METARNENTTTRSDASQAPPMSEAQKGLIQKLLDDREVSIEAIEEPLRLFCRKGFSELSIVEASGLIQLITGRSGGRRSRR